jgi:molybdopterin molybdotransferase
MKTIEQIAAELQGYDPQALTAQQVNEFLARLVEPLRETETETVGIFDALGRVLAEDVISPISVPPHDNSAMDGFAFAGAALGNAPLTLRNVGTAFAGKAWAGTVRPGECLKIMTGAIMPAGLDTVVPVELVKIDGDTVTLPPGVVKPGDNRRLLGEDLMAGNAALRRGQTLGPAALGLVASLGLPSVHVFRRAKVAYFSTGDEILSLGEAPREGAVYDSNRYTVFGLLTRMGVEVIDMGVIPDEPTQLEAAFRSAAARADAIITSGGVSMGEADHTKAMMRQCGVLAHRDAPGPPDGGGPHSGGRQVLGAVRTARQPGGGDGDLPRVRAPGAAAPDGRRGSGAGAPAGQKRRSHAQEARPHRVPARHGGARGRWFPGGAHHRQPGLGRAELHGAGQRADRAAA